MNDKIKISLGTRQITAFVLLSVLALLGNIFAPQLFTGFNYLLGSIWVMVILRLFGIGWAFFTALLAAAWCKQLFGHFYPMFWLGLEPVFVGIWLQRRPKNTMVFADTIYWVVCGAPLVFLFFMVFLKANLLGTTTAALMYSTIGITNSLIATIILNHLCIEIKVWPQRRVSPVSVSQFIFQALMLAIVLPAMLMLTITGRNRETVIKQIMFDTLEIKARQVGQEIRQNVLKGGSYPPTFGHEQRSQFTFEAVSSVLKKIKGKQPVDLYLMANKGEVIASTNPKIKASSLYDPLANGKAIKTENDQIYNLLPEDTSHIPLWQRAGRSYFVRIHIFPGTSVYSIAETPFAPYQNLILRGHCNALTGLLLYLAAGAMLAAAVAKTFATPLIQLSKTTTDLPGRLLSEDLAWPESRITEVSQLIENSREMSHTLSGQFREIAQMNSELESRVEERTLELSETNQSLRQEIDERIRAEKQRDQLMEELKLQLRFLQTLMDAIPNPIFFKGLDGRYQGFNRSFSNIMGFSSEHAIGKNLLELFPADKARFYMEKDEQLLAEGGAQQYETDLLFNDDGAIHTVLVSKATYSSLTGKFSGLIGVIVDITERKQAELERLRLMRELESKNKELESIIYVSSHDLRSPLVNIQGFSRKLAKNCIALDKILTGLELPPDKQSEIEQLIKQGMPRSINFITDSVEKMDSLLSGLLRLSRLGRAAITIENLDMNILMGKIINSLAYQIESNNVKVEVDTLLPCKGDSVQISQVFTNLLDNAIKYRSTERLLVIKVSSIACDNGVQYCVEDNGIGIHPDYQNQVWEIFHRINPRDIPGEGLGLTASRRILDRLNGTIWLESEEGVGSRFFVKLPALRS